MSRVVGHIWKHQMPKRLLALIVVGVCAVLLGGAIPAQKNGNQMQTVKSGNWSDPSVWTTSPSGSAMLTTEVVPQAGDAATINAGHTITYDVFSDAVLGEINVDGTLYFARDTDTRMKLNDNLFVNDGGYLNMGTPDNFIPQSTRAELIFVLSQAQADAFQGGPNFQATDKGLWAFPGSRWEVHGFPLLRTWSKLASDAQAGSTTVIVENDVRDWYVGGKVVITMTSNPKYSPNEYEVRTIQRLETLDQGMTKITFDQTLDYDHSGTAPLQGEVALLNRNVVLTTELLNVDDLAITDVRNRKFAHTMYMPLAQGDLQYAEFYRLGHYGKLARYATHHHQMLETSQGMIVRGNAMWQTGFRCVNLHVTHGVLIEDNVCYDSSSTAFFVEREDELGYNQDNVFVHNIAIDTKSKHYDDRNDPSIKGEFWSVASFWPAAKTNHEAYMGNVAAGVHGTDSAGGFVFPQSGNSPKSAGTIPFTFLNNEVHSAVNHGIFSWQNSVPSRDLVGTHLWRNADSGIKWGAYRQPNKFFNTKILENGDVGLRITSVGSFLQDSILVGSTVDNTIASAGYAVDKHIFAQWPSKPVWIVRNIFRDLNSTGISQNHGVCEDEINPNINMRPVLQGACSAIYIILMGNTFENVNQIFDFGSQANPNSWWKVFDHSSNNLPADFVLVRSDQINSEAVITEKLITAQTTYEPAADALLTPLNSLAGDIEFTSLLNYRPINEQHKSASPDFTFKIVPDYPPEVTLNVIMNGRMATIQAHATDDNSVTRVEFFVDWENVTTLIEPPYEVTIDLSDHPRRYAYLYVRVFDGVQQIRDYEQRTYSDVIEIGPEDLVRGRQIYLPLTLK